MTWAEVLADELSEGDNTEYGTITERVASWSSIDTGLTYILFMTGDYELTLETDEYVRLSS